jgi:hypothetical protein
MEDFNLLIKEFMKYSDTNQFTLHTKTAEGFSIVVQKNFYETPDGTKGIYLVLKIETDRIYCYRHEGQITLLHEKIYDRENKNLDGKKIKNEKIREVFFKTLVENEEDNKIGTKIINFLSKIQYCKYTCDYYTEDIKDFSYFHAKSFEAENKIFPDSFKDYECCVCYEPTKNHMLCGHYLCLVCYEKILGTRIKKCPLCRISVREFQCTSCLEEYMDEDDEDEITEVA